MNQEELNKIAPTLAKIRKQDSFIVPEGYFEKMASEIDLKLSFHLEKTDAIKPFEVPENYFETLPDTIQQQAAFDLDSIKKEETFEVPVQYFESLQEDISKQVSFHLEQEGKHNPFHTPETYFEQLPRLVQNRINNEEEKKWSLSEVLVGWLQPRYSVSLAIAIVIIALLIINPFKSENIKNACPNELACLNKKDIQQHLESNVIQDMDADEILEAIGENDGASLNLPDEEESNETNKETEEFLLNNIDENAIVDEL